MLITSYSHSVMIDKVKILKIVSRMGIFYMLFALSKLSFKNIAFLIIINIVLSFKIFKYLSYMPCYPSLFIVIIWNVIYACKKGSI